MIVYEIDGRPVEERDAVAFVADGRDIDEQHAATHVAVVAGWARSGEEQFVPLGGRQLHVYLAEAECHGCGESLGEDIEQDDWCEVCGAGEEAQR